MGKSKRRPHVVEAATPQPKPSPAQAIPRSFTVTHSIEEIKCPISLAVFFNPVQLLPCNHLVEADELKKSSQENLKCPCCRNEVTGWNNDSAYHTISNVIESAIKSKEICHNDVYFNLESFKETILIPKWASTAIGQRYITLLSNASDHLNEAVREIIGKRDSRKQSKEAVSNFLSLLKEKEQMRHLISRDSEEIINTYFQKYFEVTIRKEFIPNEEDARKALLETREAEFLGLKKNFKTEKKALPKRQGSHTTVVVAAAANDKESRAPRPGTINADEETTLLSNPSTQPTTSFFSALSALRRLDYNPIVSYVKENKVKVAIGVAATVAVITGVTYYVMREHDEVPTLAPTLIPTPWPTQIPTYMPSQIPTFEPTNIPTQVPTQVPTFEPTHIPTQVPTQVPTSVPTAIPTPVPTQIPTLKPTHIPTQVPTQVPTSVPTAIPTPVPTNVPTPVPTLNPTFEPDGERGYLGFWANMPNAAWNATSFTNQVLFFGKELACSDLLSDNAKAIANATLALAMLSWPMVQPLNTTLNPCNFPCPDPADNVCAEGLINGTETICQPTIDIIYSLEFTQYYKEWISTQYENIISWCEIFQNKQTSPCNENPNNITRIGSFFKNITAGFFGGINASTTVSCFPETRSNDGLGESIEADIMNFPHC